MASPHASSFICLPFSYHVDVVTAHTVYFSFCIVSAALGIIGAVLFLTQIIMSGSLTKSLSLGGSNSQRWILIMLAASDLLANVGVITRSCFWLIYWRPRHLDDEYGSFGEELPWAVGATIIEHWVFFWYNATYFWTLFFAVDVYNTKHGGKWKLGCSHFFTWFFCFLYITGSLCSLWTCPPYLDCAEDSLCIISHFMCTLGPLIIIMLALPLFYVSTWKQMNRIANMPSNISVADVWRKEKELSRRKILSILLVFYLCWLVNVLDGILLITAHATDSGPGHTRSTLYGYINDPVYIYIVWLLEAILNPLQGLLNAIAYGGVCTTFCTWVRNKYSSPENLYVSSWSGEYIDVDFRVNKGKIHRAKRAKAV
ncbi:G-protein coupled receptor 143-like [Halichondria panicea]|uniref:G-protein coupled receptor 143-like n=1 Tax=Halichondria panicea TaxID=6063 RepID=UPI00312BB166